MFVLTQTVRHRDFFLPVDEEGAPRQEEHAEPPSRGQSLLSLGLLLISLVAVVGLAKLESPAIESLVAKLGFPNGVVGVVIALLVLLAQTAVVGVLTVVPGRATRLQGGVHLVLFAAFLILSVQP